MRPCAASSRLALASFADEVDAELPSLDQFDHMIVRCLDCKDARWLDATDKGLALGSASPRGLWNNSVLLIEDENPRLELIAAPADAGHSVRVERGVTLAADGTAAVEETVTFNGYPAAWVRDFFRNNDRANWKDALRGAVLSNDALVRSLEVDNLDHAERSFALRASYDLRGAFSRTADGIVGRAPIGWEEELLAVAPAAERSSPFEFDIPFRFETRTRLTPPDGYSLRKRSPARGELGGEGRVSSSASESGRALELRLDVTRGTVSGPAERYDELSRQSAEVFEVMREPISLEASR